MAQIDVNLRDLYRVVRKKKWLIVFTPILMGLSTFFLTAVPAPIYNSQALIRITKSSTMAGLMTDIVNYSSYDNMATQEMVIQSRPVLEDVARKLHMIKEGDDLDVVDRAFDDLHSRVSSEQQASSDILAIKSTGPQPQETIDLANTVVAVYMQHYDDDRNKRVNDAVSYLTRRSQEANDALEEADKKLFDFRRQEAVTLTLSPAASSDIKDKEVQNKEKLNDLQSSLTTITRVRQTKDYEALLETYLIIDDGIAGAFRDQAVQRASAYIEAQNKLSDLLRYQTESAPPVQVAQQQVNTLEQRLNIQLDQLIGRLKTVVNNVTLSGNVLARQEEQADRQPEVANELDNLTIDQHEKQDSATNIRKQLQDAELQKQSKADEISIVESAHSAAGTYGPTRLYRAIIGALIGILIGGVFAFVLEAMDTSLGTIEDVEQHISSVVLGIIPHLEKEDVKDRMKFDYVTNASQEELDRFARLVTHFDPKSIGSEAYRTLRTNLASIMTKNGGKMLLVSSSMIQEGKTTSCSNIATAFAQSGKRTLLIDADLRRPSIDKIFGIARVPGLTDLLLDTRDPRECYRTIDDVMLGKFGLRLAQTTPGLEYLTILPAGRIVDKPTELLTSPALDNLFAKVRNEFDIIIVDVSPILPVADAFVLAPKVDGVVLAYQIGRVARDVLKRTKMRVESVGGKVWGVILNDIQSEIDYRSGDFSYYHYRYDSQTLAPQTWSERIRAALGLTGAKPPKRRVRRASDGGKAPSSAGKPRQSESPAPSKPPSDPAGSGSSESQDVMSITDDE